MAFLSSLAVVAATKIGFKVAEKQKWLPARVYHQLAIDKLRSGKLKDAARANAIALKKKPDYEKAMVVRDLIAMRRDALLTRLLRDIDIEESAIRDINKNSRKISRSVTSSIPMLQREVPDHVGTRS